MIGNSNGTSTRILWWIIGTLTSIVLGVGIGTSAGNRAQLDQHGQRLAVVETQLYETRTRLQRIESKIDRLLEQPR